MGLIGLSSKSFSAKKEQEDLKKNKWDLSGLTPIWSKDEKSIYAFIGTFEKEENFHYKIHLLKDKLKEEVLDYGNADSIFVEGIDYGNSIITDFIGKKFVVNDKTYTLDQHNYYELILKISELEDKNIISLSEVIGYIYSFEQELKYKNMFYLIVKD